MMKKKSIIHKFHTDYESGGGRSQGPKCIYEGCTNRATGTDRDGDRACSNRKLK
jgi:hypothetical protein